MSALKKTSKKSGLGWTKESFKKSLSDYKKANTKTSKAAQDCLVRIGTHTESGNISSRYK